VRWDGIGALGDWNHSTQGQFDLSPLFIFSLFKKMAQLMYCKNWT
jgi:hypothetical protein